MIQLTTLGIQVKTSSKLQKKTYIVVVGGYRGPSDVLDSVEIYDPTDKNWHLGR